MRHFLPPQTGVVVGTNTVFANNTQVDNGGIDVRLTQLRNLLAGTRPQPLPWPPNGSANGDMNYAYYTSASGLPATATTPLPYFMPNGIADTQSASFPDVFTTDGNGFAYVLRTTPPVAGRWGARLQSVAGGFP